MIRAESFVEVARSFGFTQYTGVPCSFLTPLINYIISDETLSYISSANEGDAVATAAGSAIAGTRSVVMMQNSGLGNAISPLTSLTYVFRIPMLIIATHRGAPGVNDEPQHELMGKITTNLFEAMQVPWAVFPTKESGIKPALERAVDYMQKQHRPYVFIMQKGTVAPYELLNEHVLKRTITSSIKKNFDNEVMLASRNEALNHIIDNTPESETIVIGSTGYTGRELYAINDRSNQLYMVGSMGCVSSFGLGISLARPDKKVVVIDGDGAALMRMGNFATAGYYAKDNFIHILLDNEVHDSTGAQSTVSANICFADIARACAYPVTYHGTDPVLIDELFLDGRHNGARLGHLKTKKGTMKDLPRPGLTPLAVLRRLMKHINSAF